LPKSSEFGAKSWATNGIVASEKNVKTLELLEMLYKTGSFKKFALDYIF
jgi:hypothetical protein